MEHFFQSPIDKEIDAHYEKVEADRRSKSRKLEGEGQLDDIAGNDGQKNEVLEDKVLVEKATYPPLKTKVELRPQDILHKWQGYIIWLSPPPSPWGGEFFVRIEKQERI